MQGSIPEDITSLDIESIDFNNKDTLKSLILKLLDTIEQLAQTNHQQYEENRALKDEIKRLKGEKYHRYFLDVPPVIRDEIDEAITKCLEEE